MEEMMVSRTAIRIKIATNVTWGAWELEVANGYLRRLFLLYPIFLAHVCKIWLQRDRFINRGFMALRFYWYIV